MRISSILKILLRVLVVLIMGVVTGIIGWIIGALIGGNFAEQFVFNSVQGKVTSIVLDFPHGSLRLLVHRDGDTHLFFGALPSSRSVKKGTFDVDELYQQLQPRLHDVVPAEARPLGQPYGMATLEFSDGNERDYQIYDQAFAEELLKVACANSVQGEDSAGKIITAECANLGGTSP